MAYLHPPHLLVLGNFQVKSSFLLLIFEKFQPAWSYYILHVYQILENFNPALLLHPARLLDTPEYCYVVSIKRTVSNLGDRTL